MYWKSSSTRVGIFLAFCCLLLLGVMPVLAVPPGQYDGLTFALGLTFWQLLSALPWFLIEKLYAPHGKTASPRKQSSPRTTVITLVAGSMFGASTYMYVLAAQKAGPVNMGLALQAYPLFAILWEAVFLGRRTSATAIGFTALMIAGLVCLATGGVSRPTELTRWSVFALGIPFLWSIAHGLLRRLLAERSVTPSQVTVTRLTISAGFLLVLQPLLASPHALAAALTDVAFQKSALILGVVYYLELMLWFHAMRHIHVSLASSVTVPAPAVTMLIAVTLLGQRVHGYQIAALAVITSGMYGLLRCGSRATQ